MGDYYRGRSCGVFPLSQLRCDVAFTHAMSLGAQLSHAFSEVAFGWKYSFDLNHYITGLLRMLIKKIGLFSYLSHTLGDLVRQVAVSGVVPTSRKAWRCGSES